MKYKIGDKVRITTEKKGCLWNCRGKMDKWLGKVMTIRDVCERCYQMQEDWGEHRGGGWLWFEEMIDGLADEQKIVITTDGKTTTAKLYDGKKFIKEAKAKCSPEDKFDFETGAEIAFSRLMNGRMNGVIDRLVDKVKELKQNRPFSGRAVFLNDDTTVIKKGKIYEFKDGQCKCDYGWKVPLTKLTRKEVETHGFLPIKE